MNNLLALVFLAACATTPSPELYWCHETSVCDGVPSDEGLWKVCVEDIHEYGVSVLDDCSYILIGWCTSYTCRVVCEPLGDCVLGGTAH